MNKESEFDFETIFPPLGHPEHHFNRHPEHPWLKTEKEIFKWLKKYDRDYKLNKRHYKIHDDLTVSIDYRKDFDVKDDVKLSLFYIPIQFREVNSVYITNSNLNSLIGVPYKSNFLYLQNNINLKNFKGVLINPKFIFNLFNSNEDFNFEHMSYNNIEILELIIGWKDGLDWDNFKGCRKLKIKMNDDFEVNDSFKEFILSLPKNIKDVDYISSKEIPFTYEYIRNYQKYSSSNKLINSTLSQELKTQNKRKL